MGLRHGAHGRHACGSRHPGFRLWACGLAPTVVMPAGAGIQGFGCGPAARRQRSSCLREQESRVPVGGLWLGTGGRHACGSRNPGFRLGACGLAPAVVMPAEAGIQGSGWGPVAWHRRSSFLRKQASRGSAVSLRLGTGGRHACGSRNPRFRLWACGPASTVVMPAEAGIQGQGNACNPATGARRDCRE